MSTIPSDDIPGDDDYSDHAFINDIWVIKKPSAIITEISFFLPVVLVGLFGNFLVVYTLYKNKQLRTPTNLMIGNMAVADLFSLLIHPWLFLVTIDIFQNYELGPVGCKLDSSIECCNLISSVISLSVISYDRLTIIVLPKDAVLNLKRTKIIIALTWIVSICLSSPLVVFRHYKERQWKDFLEKYCMEQRIIFSVYWPVIVMVLVWLPLTILLICYISIFVKLKKYEAIVLRANPRAKYGKKAARMMFIVIVTFLICRLPFTAFVFSRYARMTAASININQVYGIFYILWFSSKFMICLNAALNPLIYGLTNEKFRRNFRTAIISKWLFSVSNVKPVVAVPEIKKAKTSEHNIFFIFMRKSKSTQTDATETKVTRL